MKKLTSIFALVAAGLMLSGTVAPSVTASAAKKTGYTCLYKWTSGLNHDKYRVKNTKGKTYKMTGKVDNTKIGKASKVKLKVNHYLKNYKKNKWVRTGIAQIKHKGNWMVYYYMKPITKKKHKGGWVKLTDMKPVKTYKADKHHTADFDTWYRTLNKSQRNDYAGWAEGGALNGDGEPNQIPKEYLH